jgi:Fic family protein
MEEAIASSQIEGAATTRKVAKEMLRTGRKPKSISEKMITNNYQTMKYITEIIEDKNNTLTPKLILNIHKMITNETLENNNDEGKFRTTDDVHIQDNYSQQILYTPPSFKIISEAIKELCNYTNKRNDPYIHPIIKAISLHFLIGYIHPFVDGNGRTARAIFYWYCLKENYWLFEFLPISRIIKTAPNKYHLAYQHTETDEMDMNYFINFNLRAIQQAINNLQKYLQSKQKEIKEANRLVLKIPNINLRQSLILQEMVQHPEKIVTINEIQNTYKVVYQTARTDLENLEKKGFLSKKLSGKKLIYYKGKLFGEKIRHKK